MIVVMSLDLTNWIHVKERKIYAVVFRKDLPKVMVSKTQTFGPVKRNTIMLSNEIPDKLREILYERNIIKNLSG